MRFRGALVVTVALSATSACNRQPLDEVGGHARIPAADEVAPPGRSVPPVQNIDEVRTIHGLEAEVASLRRELKTGTRDATFVGLINAHEHLFHVADLERYLPAARKAGVTATVLVASPEFTLKGKGSQGEPSMSQNFDTLLEAAARYPGELIPFCTVDPKDADKLQRLKDHLAKGAKGVKIYSGHSNFHDGPLMPPDMEPVLAHLEATGTPVNWHINLNKFMDEFVAVITKFPKLNIMIPHYGVVFWQPTGSNMKALAELLRAHKNVYLDTSLGTRDILMFGMSAIEPARASFRAFVVEFADQVMWGTDSVITDNVEKSTGWYSKVLWTTRDHLERDVFFSELGAGYSRYYEKGRDAEGKFSGLALPTSVLQRVYVDNARRWLRLPAPVAPVAPVAPPEAAAPSTTETPE
jgi:predicted TIM-barrel fold metal-dependent hydrolase